MSTPDKDSSKDNEQVFISKYGDLVEHSHVQIDRAWKAYAILSGLITIIIVAGFTVGAIFTYKTLKDFKNDIREEKEFVSKQVQARIDVEFSEKSIATLVQNEASKKIGEIAPPLIAKNIEEVVKPAIISTGNKLDDLQNQLNKSKYELGQTSELVLLVFSAQGDDRDAFNKLATLANDNLYSLNDIASEVIRKIRTNYYMQAYRKEFMFLIYPEYNELASPKRDFSYVKNLYGSLSPEYHTHLAKIVWEREDISKEDKLLFLFEILEKDKSLSATNYAGFVIAKEFNVEWQPFEIQSLLDKQTARISPNKTK